jgi:Mor family transcriptional regulator
LSYKNGKDILPPELLEELQKYIQGELIYIPKGENPRTGWGESNGTRKFINERNNEIFRLYRNGLSITKLVERYNLSEDSIRKIIVKINKESQRELIHI